MAGNIFTTNALPVSSRSNSGGLNSTASPLQLELNEASDLQNIDFDRFGAFLKRNGYTALNTSAFNSGATWTSLHFLELVSGTDFIMGTCGNKLAKMDSFDGTWDDITGALTITAGNNNKWRWVTFLDTALGVNGVDAPVKWTGAGNGAAMTLPTNVTIVKYIAIYNSYTILAYIVLSGTTHNSRLYWSTIDSISAWNDADFRDVSKNDGQEITGIKVLGDRLVIFKEQSIWLMFFTGDADLPFTFTKSASSVGCISGDSIQEIENGLVFLAQDGLYYFDGYNSQKISDKITTTLGTFNKSRFVNVSSSYQREKNRYWCSFTTSGGSTNNRIITWDTYNNSFSIYKGQNVNCIISLRTSGTEKVYFGDYLGFVYQGDTGTDDYPSNVQTAIDAYYWTKWFDFDDLMDQKGIPHIVLYYDLNTATDTLSYSYDLGEGEQYSISFSTTGQGALWDTTGIWDSSLWASTGGLFRRFDLTGRGRLVRFKVSNSLLTQTFKINGFGGQVHLETDY